MKGSTLAMNKNKFVYTAFLAIAFAATFTACKDKRSTGLEYARNMYDPIALNPDQPVDTLNLASGKHLFTVFCSPCHGDKGDGQGHLVKIEKFSGVPDYQTGASSRGGNMADLTAGKIYHTITYGVNNMGSHASQISPTDRWKVVMYVQQLQKGQ